MSDSGRGKDGSRKNKVGEPPGLRSQHTRLKSVPLPFGTVHALFALFSNFKEFIIFVNRFDRSHFV